MADANLPTHLVGFSERAAEWLVRAGVSVAAVLVVTWGTARLYRMTVHRFRDAVERKSLERADPGSHEEVRKRMLTLSGILRKAGTAAIWVIGGTIALKQTGVDIAPILAGAGIIGLAVGFGAQSLVRDVISGFFIILEDQIRVGDVAAINGTTGVVEEINLRTIVLRDLAGVVHTFPNGNVTTVANMTKDWSAAILDIGVAYGEDTDEVAGVMAEVAEALRADPDWRDRVIEPLEVLGVDAFADSAVVVKARLKTRPMQQWAVGREYRRRLKKAFDERGIEIPFPHTTIAWGKASGPFRPQAPRPG